METVSTENGKFETRQEGRGCLFYLAILFGLGLALSYLFPQKPQVAGGDSLPAARTATPEDAEAMAGAKAEVAELDALKTIAGVEESVEEFAGLTLVALARRQAGLKAPVVSCRLGAPGYTAAELAGIFRLLAKSRQYVLSEDVEKWLDAYMETAVADDEEGADRGRWVLELFEQAVRRQALRVAAVDEPARAMLLTLTMKDVGIQLEDADASNED